jgi:hypothetical protein
LRNYLPNGLVVTPAAVAAGVPAAGVPADGVPADGVPAAGAGVDAAVGTGCVTQLMTGGVAAVAVHITTSLFVVSINHVELPPDELVPPLLENSAMYGSPVVAGGVVV